MMSVPDGDFTTEMLQQLEAVWAVLVDLYREDLLDEDTRYRVEDLAEEYDLDL